MSEILRETYRGQKLAARTTKAGFVWTFINNHKVGIVAGTDVSGQLKTLRGYVDSAADRPEAFRTLVTPGSVLPA